MLVLWENQIKNIEFGILKHNTWFRYYVLKFPIFLFCGSWLASDLCNTILQILKICFCFFRPKMLAFFLSWSQFLDISYKFAIIHKLNHLLGLGVCFETYLPQITTPSGISFVRPCTIFNLVYQMYIFLCMYVKNILYSVLPIKYLLFCFSVF